ncbi:hypothetical protein [Chryseobacterium profundimaris]|uniref:Right handed beta helix domain-containing protein n=1 Tax=Chryseobacterium profundimaris TaxID=1387275 RepID=A0ABY1NNC7_9FLAO|nr:hypothetical protein [Chryseobacterium profundimaris]SMP13194.1 hypothetical protein SAMN06264346_102545 [Chryseobacterium profundimaris]
MNKPNTAFNQFQNDNLSTEDQDKTDTSVLLSNQTDADSLNTITAQPDASNLNDEEGVRGKMTSGVTTTTLNPASDYLVYWDGNDFAASGVYYDGVKYGIDTTTPSEMFHLNNGRLRTKAVVFDENTETLPHQITINNERFYGTDLNATARTFMYRDFADYKALLGSLTNAQKIDLQFDFDYLETGVWYDGITPMTPGRVDDNIFIQKGNKYFQKTISRDILIKIGTVSELRQTNAYYEGQEALLLGYYVSGDKSPVVYKFTVADYSTLVDDEGSIIKTSKGSWIAQFNDSVTIKDYGAHSGTNIRSKLETASKKARDLRLVLDINSDLNLTESINIYSDIVSTNRAKVYNVANINFVLADNSIKRISGIEFTGNLDSSTDGAPVALQVKSTLSNLENFTIDHCTFKNCRVKLNNQQTDSLYKNIKFVNNVADVDFSTLPIGNTQNDFITIHGSEFIQFSKNKITSKGVNRVGKLQSIANNANLNTSRVIISDNEINSIGTTDAELGQSRQIFDFFDLSRDIIIKNNFIKATNHTSFFEDKSLENLVFDKTYLIEGNVFENDVDIISIRSNAGREGKLPEEIGKTFVKIVDNTFIKSGNNTIEQGFVEVSFVDDLLVKGNSFVNKGTATSGLGIYGLYMRNNINSNISENYAVNFTFYCVLVGSYLEKNYNRNAENLFFKDNYFKSNAVAVNHISITKSGTHSLIFNVINILNNYGSYPGNTNYRFIRIANSVVNLVRIINNTSDYTIGYTNTGNTITKSIIHSNSWTTQDSVLFPSATTAVYGLVKQSAVIANVVSANAVNHNDSTATDIAGIITDLNDLISKFNAVVTLVNETKNQLNASFAANRTSGQQAT